MDYLHEVWILTLSGQSMDCLLNPRIEHAQSMADWGNPWIGIVCSIQGLSMPKYRLGQSMDCSRIQGLRVGQSTDCPKYGLSSYDYFEQAIHGLSKHKMTH